MLHADEMATVWVITPGPRERLVTTFLEDGEIGVIYPALGDGRDLDRARTEKLLADAGVPRVDAEAKLFLSFVRRMNVGDIVAMPDHHAGGIVIGVVAGDYVFRDDVDVSRARHRRPVEWRRRLPLSALPERLAHIASSRHDIVEESDGRLRDLALRCTRGELGDDPADRPRAPAATRRSASGSPRAPRAPRAPKRPPRATMPERRCTSCLVVKSEDLFDDDGDLCRDCA